MGLFVQIGVNWCEVDRILQIRKSNELQSQWVLVSFPSFFLHFEAINDNRLFDFDFAVCFKKDFA